MDIYPFRINEKWGLTNKNGEILLEPSFELIKPFKNNLALTKTKNNFGFIDKKGNWIIKPKYSKAEEFKYDCSKVKYKGKEFYINKKGKRVSFTSCKESRLIAGCFPGNKLEDINKYILQKDTLLAIKYRQIDDTTKFVYQAVNRFDVDFFVVKRNNKYGFFFRPIPRVYKGDTYIADTLERYEYDELIIPLPPKSKYDSNLYYSNHQYFKFRKGNLWGILNSFRQEIIPAKYHSIEIIDDETIFLVEYLPNCFGYIDNTGNEKFKTDTNKAQNVNSH